MKLNGLNSTLILTMETFYSVKKLTLKF